jgi:C_GCAxxG_C_C family probable redox protein
VNHSQLAGELFYKGYNCSQAVVAAFSDIIGIDEKAMLKIASSFGGGMGRMREVCGAVSGALIVLGLLYGYSDTDYEKKKEHYALVRRFASEFKEETGSIICREMLSGIVSDTTEDPEKRTEEYYKKRPCRNIIELSAKIVDKIILEKGLPDENKI